MPNWMSSAQFLSCADALHWLFRKLSYKIQFQNWELKSMGSCLGAKWLDQPMAQLVSFASLVQWFFLQIGFTRLWLWIKRGSWVRGSASVVHQHYSEQTCMRKRQSTLRAAVSAEKLGKEKEPTEGTALPDVFSLQVDSCGWEDCHGIFHRSAESPLRFELGRGLISIVYVESLKSWCMLAEVACWKWHAYAFGWRSLCIMCGCSRNSLLFVLVLGFSFSNLIDLVLGFCLLIESDRGCSTVPLGVRVFVLEIGGYGRATASLHLPRSWPSWPLGTGAWPSPWSWCEASPGSGCTSQWRRFHAVIFTFAWHRFHRFRFPLQLHFCQLARWF